MWMNIGDRYANPHALSVILCASLHDTQARSNRADSSQTTTFKSFVFEDFLLNRETDAKRIRSLLW
jgi:hypothetical protein